MRIFWNHRKNWEQEKRHQKETCKTALLISRSWWSVDQAKEANKPQNVELTVAVCIHIDFKPAKAELPLCLLTSKHLSRRPDVFGSMSHNCWSAMSVIGLPFGSRTRDLTTQTMCGSSTHRSVLQFAKEKERPLPLLSYFIQIAWYMKNPLVKPSVRLLLEVSKKKKDYVEPCGPNSEALAPPCHTLP